MRLIQLCKMDPQIKKLITTGVLLLMFFVLGGIYYFLPASTEDAPPQGVGTPSPESPSLTFQIKDDHTITFIWKYLPDGTKYVNIYRARKGTQDWTFWKRVTIAEAERLGGTIDFLLGPKEKSGDYDYYGEAIGDDEKPLWKSPGGAPLPPPPSGTGNPPPSPGNTTTTTPVTPGTPAPTSSLPLKPAPTSTPPPPPSGAIPPSGAPQCPPGMPCYYTPQLTLSGTSTPPTASFWVHHVNDDIELGWQGLPTSTTRIIALRAVAETGPWVELLRQQNPVQILYYRIRFSDETLYETRYYKIERYEGAIKKDTYGPLLLNAFPR